MDDTSEFRRGWRVLLGGVLGIGAGVSSLYFYSLGIFIKPLAAQFGWSRAEASLGALVGTLCAAVMSPVIGALVDRFGSLRVALCSLVLLSAGFFAHAVLIQGLGSFLLVTGISSLLTAGTSPLPYSRLTVTAFSRHRGLALGLVLAGTAIGATFVPRLLTPLVASDGWRTGYFVLGLTSLLAIAPVWLLLRGNTETRASKASTITYSQIIANPAFRALATMFLLAAMAVLGTVVQFVPMLSDAGLGPAQAGRIAGIIGIAALFGRLIVGTLLDRGAPLVVTAGLFTTAALGLLAMYLGGTGLALVGALATGVAVGAEVDLLAFLTGRYFPMAAFGRANGLLYAVFLLGGAIGPVLAGRLYDLSSTHALWLITATALLLVAALIGLLHHKAERCKVSILPAET